MVGEQSRYLSYLLRLWQTSSDNEQIWRASLETPGTGERRGFASMKELFDFLEVQTGQTTPSDERNSHCGANKAG